MEFQMAIQKIKTTVESFVAALKTCVVEKKTTIPTLNNVFVQDNQLLSTDLDMHATVSFPATGKGRFLLPHAAALKVLTGRKGALSIEYTPGADKSKGGSVRLVLEGSAYKFDSMSLSNYPEFPAPAKTTLTITGAEFNIMLERSLFATPKEDSRYTLKGALLESVKDVGEPTLRICATDGHRLSIVESLSVEGEKPSCKGKLAPVIASREALAWVKSRMGLCVEVGADAERVTFKSANFTLVSRVTKGNFPNWQAATPVKKNLPITVTITEIPAMLTNLKSVGKCADANSSCVKFTFGKKNVAMSARSEAGEAEETTVACTANATVSIGLNGKYVEELLKSIKDEESLEIGLRDGQSAVLFSVDGFKHIIMPMRL